MATKNSTRKAIIYINDTTAQVTKAFEKKACIFGTDEFNLWREYKKLYPDAKMITKKIKKSENQKKRRNRKFENMVEFIQTQPNAEELMAEYEYIQKRSKVQTSPYQYVLEWFEAKFKGYDDLEQFMNQKEEERKQKEAEAAAEKAATTAQND
jgi:hypothetical protein